MKILEWLARVKYKLLVLSAIIFVVILSLFFAFFEYSTSPKFCNTCHFMKPYYESWKGSSHNFVKCVECHYEPGLLNELKGKWLAIKTFAAAIAGSYSPKPYAEISDASCLRSGCHSERLLSGKVRFTERNVLFDHKPHLEEMRHGIKLTCTSCHSQIVIGSHIRATVSTCSLCHFKGGTKRVERESPIGGCGVCHTAPAQPVKIGDYTVSHTEFVQRGIECTRCHIDVTYGDGEATKDKCFHCHNQLEKVERFNETEFIHINHVTVHKVDCGRCHNEIIHKFNTRIVETQHQVCQSCHEQTHFPQSALYAGKGAKGIEGEPDPMYLLGISCSGCHTVPKHDPETAIIKGQTFTSGNLPCVSCHQEKYTRFVETFNSEWTLMFNYLENRSSNIEQKTGLQKDTKVLKLLESVRYNLEFLKNAKGIHNPFYSVEILKGCDMNLIEAEKIFGEETKAQKPVGLTENNCPMCHNAIELSQITELKDGRKFSHKVHLENTPECRNCHIEGHHPPKVNFKEACNVCH